MGLDFRVKGVAQEFVDRSHWSCSIFHEFRKGIALKVGIYLNEMEGFDSILSTEQSFSARSPKKWPKSDDPIFLFLRHSDCDGELSADECARVAPRLRQLLEGMHEFYQDEAELLIKQMELAASKGKPLIFSA